VALAQGAAQESRNVSGLLADNHEADARFFQRRRCQTQRETIVNFEDGNGIDFAGIHCDSTLRPSAGCVNSAIVALYRACRSEPGNISSPVHVRQLMQRFLTMARTLIFSALALLVTRVDGQAIMPLDAIQNQADLDKTVAALDAALFDAYNRCDLEKFRSFFADDVEFYHDQGGVTLGSAKLTESVKQNICGKTTRELVPGTLQVYYMKGYGAVEMGVHRFHHPGHEDTEGVGEGRFVHLWQSKDGVWKITRAISYDHHAAPK
jgi:ketosteroid isomerase-like protein